MKFVTDVFSEEQSNVTFFGVECPDSVREVSQLVEPFDVIERRNFLDDVRIFDAGDIDIIKVEEKVKEILEKGKFPLMYAKEHTASLYSMKSMPEGTKLIVFDAHADLKDEYEGSKFSHACWLRRWCELSKENLKNVVVIGVRSGDEDEIAFAIDNDIKYFTMRDVKEEFENVKRYLENFVKDSNVYISLDMDVFDPSIAPAVKYPEPNGITYENFVRLANVHKGGKLVGLDFVEIRPIKGNNITEFLAVKSVFTILSY